MSKRAVCVLVVILLTTHLITEYARTSNSVQQRAPVENFTSDEDTFLRHKHLAVVSSTYFKNDTSYGNNVVVMVVNAENPVNYSLSCWSKNATNTTLNRIDDWPITALVTKPCLWASRIAACNVVENPTEFAITDINELADITKSRRIVIPLRKPISVKYDVVACYSPVFFAEKWQTLVPLLEVHRQYGVNMQVFYVESAVTTIVDYLSIYITKGLVHIEPWYSTPVNLKAPGLDYDPNKEIMFRNQVGAHSDCLLFFKQSAEYIIFTDVDEVLFPKLGKTYLDEFRYLSTLVDEAASFTYMRHDATYTASSDPRSFSVRSMLKNSIVANGAGPKCVARPFRVRSVAWHRCLNVQGFVSVKVPEMLNFMLHLRYEERNEETRNASWHQHQIEFLVSDKALDEIERNFRQFISSAHASDKLSRLPRKEHYFSIFFDYYARFYRLFRSRRLDYCPSHLQLKIPEIPRLACSIASVPYAFETLPSNITVHYRLSKGRLTQKENGCK